ncbi:MAG: hypothetical protein ACK4FM_00530 [Caldimicrobium sp.]
MLMQKISLEKAIKQLKEELELSEIQSLVLEKYFKKQFEVKDLIRDAAFIVALDFFIEKTLPSIIKNKFSPSFFWDGDLDKISYMELIDKLYGEGEFSKKYLIRTLKLKEYEDEIDDYIKNHLPYQTIKPILEDKIKEDLNNPRKRKKILANAIDKLFIPMLWETMEAEMLKEIESLELEFIDKSIEEIVDNQETKESLKDYLEKVEYLLKKAKVKDNNLKNYNIDFIKILKSL